MAMVLKAIGGEGEIMDVMLIVLIGKIFCLMLILPLLKNIDLSESISLSIFKACNAMN